MHLQLKSSDTKSCLFCIFIFYILFPHIEQVLGGFISLLDMAKKTATVHRNTDGKWLLFRSDAFSILCNIYTTAHKINAPLNVV
jgi:hypothetical protein